MFIATGPSPCSSDVVAKSQIVSTSKRAAHITPTELEPLALSLL